MPALEMPHYFDHIYTLHLRWAHQRCSLWCETLSRSACAPALAHLTQHKDSHEDLVHMVSWISALCGCAMPWADVAFSGCLGSSRIIFIGRALLCQALERRCPPYTLFSGATSWQQRAGIVPGLLSLKSSPCVCSQPWPWLAVLICRGKN